VVKGKHEVVVSNIWAVRGCFVSAHFLIELSGEHV
jgi:hypothetical protein